ncbi:unnamed protein product [Dovyalis caffra]|uniref:Uncharacterized protein n=1 Tax=Dovyalis caffra TaxID=77055 RepID=A0AAV1RW50_9ROSI|nr:unnamed protein product [Dovyalis caffra]
MVLCGCSPSIDHQYHADGSLDKRLLEYSKKESSGDEKQKLTPLQEELAEALVWFKNNCALRESLKSKSSSAPEFVNPLKVSVPKKRRGCEEGLLQKKGHQSSTDQEAKKTSVGTLDELGFSSKNTQSTYSDQEDSKSTISSVNGFANPLGILEPKKKRGISRQKFVKTSHDYHINTHEDGPKLKIKRREKKTAGGKQICKRQRTNNEDDRKDRGERPSKKRQMVRVDFKKLGLNPAPNFSSQIRARIGHQEGRDSEIKLRIMKQIFKTDMDRHQERFSMPLNQVKDNEEFLNEEEMEKMCQTKSSGTEVKLVEMGLKNGNVHESTMRLRQWKINNNASYMITSNWKDVLDRNVGSLKLNDIVQVYSFRRDKKLWLVLLKIKDADEVKNLMGWDQVGSDNA